MGIDWQEVTLPVSFLRFQPDYQKYLDYEWIDKLVADNTPDAWEPISVLSCSKRAYVVKDGNHRAVAAKRLGLKKVSCELFVIEE